MGLRTLLWNGTKAIANAAVWTVSGALNITANTISYLWQGGQAVGDAGRTLIYNPEARTVAKKMAYMAVYDVLPLVTVYYTNKWVQSYFAQPQSEEQRQIEEQQNNALGLMAYSSFQHMLRLLDGGARYYTISRGVQSTVRMLVLESRAAPAFNSNKITPPSSLCTELKCNGKRELKGLLREPLILMANEWLCSAIGDTIGYYPTQLLKILIYGRYITRQVTPERCERHKEMVLESVLALGLGYYASITLLESIFDPTGGRPLALAFSFSNIPNWLFDKIDRLSPALAYRTISRLLLLLHVNLAAHTTIPIRPESTPLYRDLLNLYERLIRGILDVQQDGLESRIKKGDFDFAAAPPIFPLSVGLRFFTRLLNSDLPKIKTEQPLPALPDGNKSKESEQFRKAKEVMQAIRTVAENTVRKGADITWYLAVPPMFRGIDGFIKDPIVADHWLVIRDGVISGIEIINGIGRTGKVSAPLINKAAVWAPDGTALLLNLKWGIPKVVTKVGLKLSRKEDFWELARAILLKMKRLGIECNVELDEPSGVALNGEKELIPLPPTAADAPPPIPVLQLGSERLNATPALPPEQLVSTERPSSVGFFAAAPLDPDSLVTTRVRRSVGSESAAGALVRVVESESVAGALALVEVVESEPVAGAAARVESVAGVPGAVGGLGLSAAFATQSGTTPHPDSLFSTRRRAPTSGGSAGTSLAFS